MISLDFFLMFVRIITSLLMMITGAALMKYRKEVYDFTGPFGWAEKYMGTGGTSTAIVLIGFGLVIISILYLFGYFELGAPASGLPGAPTTNS